MTFDGLVVSAVTDELRRLIGGGRIDKVQQPTDSDLVLTIRKERQSHRLLLSANKAYPRLHVTTRFHAPNPALAPMFCMLLRKHIEGGRIGTIRQISRERIVDIAIETRDEVGEAVTRHLIIEIMGKHSNILLLDREQGTIIDAISHVSSRVNRYREILPGRDYVSPPPQAKSDPFDETKDGYTQKRSEQTQERIDRYLVNNYLGISPLFAKEIAYRLEQKHGAQGTIQQEALQFLAVIEQVKSKIEPTIWYDAKNEADGFYLLPLQRVQEKKITHESLHEVIDLYYSSRALSDIARGKVGNYLRMMRNESERCLAKIEKLRDWLDQQDDAEIWRTKGELLTAYLHQVQKGLTSVQLPNFYDDERMLFIELDPALTPLENANKYFKRYTKFKKGWQITKDQLEIAKHDLQYIESVLHELEHCQLAEVAAIEEELRTSGYLKTVVNKGKKTQPDKKQNKMVPNTYLSSDNIRIFVGRNNQENDFITFKQARKNHFWLHVKDAPGSHVIIEHDHPPDSTIEEAAILAAFYSKLKGSTRIPVDLVEVKDLFRPNGAKPGFVLFTGQKTLSVAIDETILDRLLKQATLPQSK